MESLESLFPVEKELQFGTRVVKIKTVELGNIPTLLKTIDPFLKSNNRKETALNMFQNDFESVLKLFEITTDLSTDEIKKMSLAAAMIIFNAVLKENSDFLVEKVIPHLQEMAKSLPGLNQSKP